MVATRRSKNIYAGFGAVGGSERSPLYLLKQSSVFLVEHHALDDNTDYGLGVEVGEPHAGVITDSTALDDGKSVGFEILYGLVVVRDYETQVMKSWAVFVQKVLVNTASG